MSTTRQTPGNSTACRAMIFDPDARSFHCELMEPPALAAGQILVKPRLSAICGSDLHTEGGHRHPGGPLVLGHEICGTVEGLGPGVERDFRGLPLEVGSRVTWSLTASCGQCFFCRAGLPQKCETVFKYGHATLSDQPALSGGFAEAVILRRGTSVFRLPESLPDATVVFANCALATAVAAVRQARISRGEAVLIQGGGLLGLCASVVAREAGAARVEVVEAEPGRQRWARDFGADAVHLPGAVDISGRGFDAVFEMCGQPAALAEGLAVLRTGGRYVLCGCVFPGAETRLDLDRVTRGCLQLTGVHNYRPGDLEGALRLLEAAGGRYPFDRVVAEVMPLEDLASAFAMARTRKDILRVAVRM